MAADIAAVFHWSVSDMEDLEASELRSWHKLAIERIPKFKG